MGPILIVEDDATIRSLVEQVLDDDGFETMTAHDGDDALRALVVRQPACVLLDLDLPVLDGLGFLHELTQRCIRVPVLLITADPRGDRLGLPDGVVGHIPKPFDLDALVLAVRIVTDVWSPAWESPPTHGA